MNLSILIVNWNTRELLRDCLNSIYETVEGLAFDVIVVDNNSGDGSQEMVRQQFPQVQLIENAANVGFARANNQAIAASRGRYVLLLNSDTIVQPGALRAMLTYADGYPDVGVVGAHLLNADGSFQASHTRFPTLRREFLILSGLGRLLFGRWYPSHSPEQSRAVADADYVEGACMLARREAVDQVGGLDEGYFMYAEEVDWCFSMRRAGWRVVYLPQARIVHLGGASSKSNTRREAVLYRSRVRFFRKHYGPVHATLLKGLIYTLTAVKMVWHRLRRGRAVVGLRELRAELRGL
jgi:GT2 family glycosyltransferase